MSIHYISYRNGCLQVKRTGEYIVVSSNGFSIEIRPRIITVKGVKEAEEKPIYSAKRKSIYIYHDSIDALEKCPDKPDELLLGDYMVKKTSLFTGEYITIITPGYSLIEYLVITDRVTVIVTQGGRNVYFERGDDTIAVYIA